VRSLILLSAALAASGCWQNTCEGPGWVPSSLVPYDNPFTSDDPLWSEQPHRDKPLEVVIAESRGKAYVSLQGTVDDPGHEVVVVDLATREVVARIDTEGSGPTGLALHPDEDKLVVFHRFSDFAAVISTDSDAVEEQLPTDFYAIEGAFSPDGEELWMSNRWLDAAVVWTDLESCDGVAIPVGDNPRDVAMSPDGETVAVAAMTGMTVSLIDRAEREERHRVELGAPANGLAFAGDWLVVATLSASTHHPPLEGPDTNHDGLPGDGTPNVNFQDLQNEIAVIDPLTGEIVHRYTSDTICCEDYRDVDPDDLERLGDLLPPRETWIVEGSLPEQVAVDGDAVYVTYSGSNQVQSFTIDPASGALTPEVTWQTEGHNPHGLAAAGGEILVAHRLSETLGFYGADGEASASPEVGDLSGGVFPSTDAELGEFLNFVTGPFSVDGDQSCSHCHREGGNFDKAFSMPLTRYEGLGMRMTMAYRGAADTRPWFFEGAMDESNFKPVLNEFARIENFCCTDYTLFPDGAPEGCEDDPPPECETADNTGSADGFAADRDRDFTHPRPTAHPTREAFYQATAEAMLGRGESFGDALYYEDLLTGERQPVALDFDGLTRALGIFLLNQPRLLPNPNDPERPAAARGEALFNSLETSCATCHPAPTFAVSSDHNPFELPVRMGPVVTPNRGEDDVNLDLFAQGFVDTFPLAEQDACEDICDPAACEEDVFVCDDLMDVRFGVTTLRGIWDRAESMLHDGRAKGLREVLATPGHPALRAGEVGFNERNGVPDTHGGTSQLSAEDIEDLIAYMETL